MTHDVMQPSAINSVVIWTFGVIFVATLAAVLLLVKRRMTVQNIKKKNLKPPPGIARELSQVERCYKYVTDQSIGLIGGKFIMRSETPLDEDYFKSLTRCIWNYAPLMRMKITEETNVHDKQDRHFYFEELPETVWEDVLSYRSLGEEGEDGLLKEVLKEICIPFNASQGPLWRMIVYNIDNDPANPDGFKYSKGIFSLMPFQNLAVQSFHTTLRKTKFPSAEF